LDDIKKFMKYCKYEIRGLDQSDHEYSTVTRLMNVAILFNVS
jgi:hypothetical protein